MRLKEWQYYITSLYLEKIANVSDSASVQELSASTDICP